MRGDGPCVKRGVETLTTFYTTSGSAFGRRVDLSFPTFPVLGRWVWQLWFSAAFLLLLIFALTCRSVLAQAPGRDAHIAPALELDQLRRQALINESKFLDVLAETIARNGNIEIAKNLVSLAMPMNLATPERPFVAGGLISLPVIIEEERPSTRDPLHVLGAENVDMDRAQFSPDGTTLLTRRACVFPDDPCDGTSWVRLWRTADGTLFHALHDPQSSVVADAAFDPEGKRLATAAGRVARIWDVESGAQIRSLTHGSELATVAFSPDGSLVLTEVLTDLGRDVRSSVWDAGTGALLYEFDQREAISADFAPDGTRLVYVLESGMVHVIDARTGDVFHELGGDGIAKTAIFAADGQRVLTTSSDHRARLWNADNGELLHVFGSDAYPVDTALMSPDGRSVLTWSGSQLVLWDAATSARQRVLAGHEDKVTGATFSPDGRRVLSESDDGTARLWAVGTGEPVLVIPEHHDYWGQWGAVIFSRDSKLLLTKSDDDIARIWDASTGAILKTIEGAVWKPDLSPDATLVATIDESGKAVRVWRVPGPLHDELGYLRASITRPLTDHELITLRVDRDDEAPVTAMTNGERCDALAGHPFNPDGDGHAAWSLLDHMAAIEACGRALEEQPENPRLLYQLARAQLHLYGTTCTASALEDCPEKPTMEMITANFHASDEAARKRGAENYPMALFGLATLQATPEAEAMTDLRIAHEAGVIVAARYISQLLERGKGGTKDFVEALRWLRLGAEEGDPWAHEDLGRLYATGNEEFGIIRDPAKALFHFSVAVKLFAGSGHGRGEEIAAPMKERASSVRGMTTAEVAEIWDRAQAWEPGYPLDR